MSRELIVFLTIHLINHSPFNYFPMYSLSSSLSVSFLVPVGLSIDGCEVSKVERLGRPIIMPITKLMMAVSASITKIETLGLQNKILNVTSWLFCIIMMVSRMVTTIRKIVLMRIVIVLNRYTKMLF